MTRPKHDIDRPRRPGLGAALRWLAGLIICVELVAFGLAGPLAAQQGASEPAIALPSPLTEQSIRDTLAALDDRQVRELALQLLAGAVAQETESGPAKPPFSQDLAKGLSTFGGFLADVMTKLPRVPEQVAQALDNFQRDRGAAPIWQFGLALAVVVAIGSAASYPLQVLRKRLFRLGASGEPPRLNVRVAFLAGLFLTRILRIAVFILAGLVASYWATRAVAADRIAIDAILFAAGWSALVYSVAALLLAPDAPAMRLCSVSDKGARYLANGALAIALIFNFGFGLSAWLDANGADYRDSWHGFWVNAVLHLALLGLIWGGREHIRSILRGSSAAGSSFETGIASNWPALLMGLVAIQWVVVEYFVATRYVQGNLFTAMSVSLAIVGGLPFFDLAARAILLDVLQRRMSQAPALAKANETTERGLLRIVRVVLATLAATLLMVVWNISMDQVAQIYMGRGASEALVSILLILATAYALWEVLTITVERKIDIERAARGLSAGSNDIAEGEGGGEGARLGTLLPLVRTSARVMILILTVLAVFGQLGINVLPFLAGAGVVGIAIGFGAQTLVRDIVSGIFFLIDDAFRLGEYIDLGFAKGTVEKISIRSMQLRHHRGALNTIPFGEIRNIANFARDWVIMRFPLRITYDSNAEQVRKLVKGLGAELLDDPEFGDKFLEPLKCPGVVEMDDSAMIMPVKFMCRPGEQWALRRLVLNRIHELFAQNGIKFANRAVTVNVVGPENSTASADDRKVFGAAAAAQLPDDAPAGKV